MLAFGRTLIYVVEIETEIDIITLSKVNRFSKILSLLDLYKTVLNTRCKNFHLTVKALLHYFVKFRNLIAAELPLNSVKGWPNYLSCNTVCACHIEIKGYLLTYLLNAFKERCTVEMFVGNTYSRPISLEIWKNCENQLIFGRPFVKRFALCYGTVVLSVPWLPSVCNVGVLWPNCWTDQDETWHAGRLRPWPHCVRWGPSSPPKGA